MLQMLILLGQIVHFLEINHISPLTNWVDDLVLLNCKGRGRMLSS